MASNGKQVISGGDRGGADSFGKGIVGKPSETDSIRHDGNQDSMGEKTLNYGGGHFEQEKSGLEDGVNARETINLDDVEPNYDYSVDSFTGNAPERKVGRSNNHDCTGKAGKRFEIGEM